MNRLIFVLKVFKDAEHLIVLYICFQRRPSGLGITVYSCLGGGGGGGGLTLFCKTKRNEMQLYVK